MFSTVSPRIRHLLSTTTLATLYVLFVSAHATNLIENGFRLSSALLLVFESMIVMLVFFRRPTEDTDVSTATVFAGFLGTVMPLALRPTGGGQDLLVGQIVQIAGAVFQVGSAASIGRSFGIMPANRGIQTAGLYRLVRHPFYMSYLVTQVGYVISNLSTYNLIVLALATSFQVLRINFEERLLRNDVDYVAYTGTVRWHLVPGVW